jgi:hypothetical protein
MRRDAAGKVLWKADIGLALDVGINVGSIELIRDLSTRLDSRRTSPGSGLDTLADASSSPHRSRYQPNGGSQTGL